MMKKIVLLLSLLFIYSCTSEEEEQEEQGSHFQTTISPPEWIQGKWNNGQGTEFECTKSNIIWDSSGNIYKVTGEIWYYTIQDIDPEIVEKQTDTTYTLQYKVSASEIRKFNFYKISDNKIESKNFFKGIYTRK